MSQVSTSCPLGDNDQCLMNYLCNNASLASVQAHDAVCAPKYS
jgi:hypothetical protein